MQVGDEPPEDDDQRRLLEQMTLLSQSAQESGHRVRWDWDDDEPDDQSAREGRRDDRQPHAYDPEALLAREEIAGDVVARLNEAGTFGDVPDAVPLEEAPTREPLGLMRVLLPEQPTEGDGPDDRVRRALQLLEDQGMNSAVRELEDDDGDRGESDEDDQRPLQDVAPDHWIHLAPGGGTRICPATEPAETGRRSPWPTVAADLGLGKDVRVVVIDTGWHPPSGNANGPTPWLSSGVDGELEDNTTSAPLGHYAGHGTFIAGIVKCVAPAATVQVLRFMAGDTLRESDMVLAMRRALDMYEPHLISLSAGAVTRRRRRPLSFELFWRNDLRHVDNCLLVAAAGNDGVPRPMWPAAFRWAVGVGSLDHDHRVSSFSNWGPPPLVDVYAVGRNLVSAYPDGRYVCHEAPNRGESRYFRTGMARWSGTSFSTPVVVGMIAAEMTRSGSDVATAKATVLAGATQEPGHAGSGMVDKLLPPYT